ncbi:hypothetical protein FQZ97_1134870 [compost metagenome]
MPSKACIMRKASTGVGSDIGHNAQFFGEWLYPMSIVSMVTIIRSNGARKAARGGITSPSAAR